MNLEHQPKTVDNAANMDVAANITKFPCFAHTLNLGAQKLYNCRSCTTEIQFHLSAELPQHMLLLDVRTRWRKTLLCLMIERFCEQFPAIQASAIDQRLRNFMEKK